MSWLVIGVATLLVTLVLWVADMSPILMIAVPMLILFVFMVIKYGAIITPEGHVTMTTRFGKHSKIKKSGLGFIIPFLDRIKTLVPINDQEKIIKQQEILTADNKIIYVDTLVVIRVVGPYKVVYGADGNVYSIIYDLIKHNLLILLSTKTYDDIRTSRDVLADDVLNNLHDIILESYGIEVGALKIEKADPSKKVMEVLELEAIERKKLDAARINARTKKVDEQAKAEALANKIKTIAKQTGLESLEVAKLLKAMKLYEQYGKIAEGPSNMFVTDTQNGEFPSVIQPGAIDGQQVRSQ